MQYLVDMKLAAYGRPTGGPRTGFLSLSSTFFLALSYARNWRVKSGSWREDLQTEPSGSF